MAEAKIATKLIPVTTHKEERQVTLTLTPEEAVFLATILCFVGGPPDTSPRKYQETIADSLSKVGIYGAPGDLLNREKCGIYFKPDTLMVSEFIRMVDRVKRGY